MLRQASFVKILVFASFFLFYWIFNGFEGDKLQSCHKLVDKSPWKFLQIFFASSSVNFFPLPSRRATLSRQKNDKCIQSQFSENQNRKKHKNLIINAKAGNRIALLPKKNLQILRKTINKFLFRVSFNFFFFYFVAVVPWRTIFAYISLLVWHFMSLLCSGPQKRLQNIFF